jgi:hypothetical protein
LQKISIIPDRFGCSLSQGTCESETKGDLIYATDASDSLTMSSKEQSIETFLRELETALDKDARSKAPAQRVVQNPFAGAAPQRLQDKLKPLLSNEVAASGTTARALPSEPLPPHLVPAPQAAQADAASNAPAEHAPKTTGRVVMAALVLVVGALAVLGIILLLTPPKPPETASPPAPVTTPAQPATAAAVPAPVVPPNAVAAPIPASPPVVAAAPTTEPSPQQQSGVSMGAVSPDLIAPTTEGLSAPRRIRTQLILMDGDREIVQPR